MAKVQIKSEKLTPFGGIFSIMEQFDSMLSPIIDQALGQWVQGEESDRTHLDRIINMSKRFEIREKSYVHELFMFGPCHHHQQLSMPPTPSRLPSNR